MQVSQQTSSTDQQTAGRLIDVASTGDGARSACSLFIDIDGDPIDKPPRQAGLAGFEASRSRFSPERAAPDGPTTADNAICQAPSQLSRTSHRVERHQLRVAFRCVPFTLHPLSLTPSFFCPFVLLYYFPWMLNALSKQVKIITNICIISFII